MKTSGTTHKTFTRTTHLILYLILVIIFGFISCRFAKASGATYGNPTDSIRIKESINQEDLYYYFRKAIEPVREQSIWLEDWMLDTGNGNFDTRIIEPEIRLESWMLPAKGR